ncbi:hypothetical protein [Peribacillus simplex]|uniref:hypothetical protein n=1 Tax=Peribacillus simplex TaxID=1478 RepID=UPI003CFFC79F
MEIDHKLPQNVCNSHTASNDDNSWVLCKGCNIAKGTRILLEVITDIPSEIVIPMLLQKYATPFAKKHFKSVTVSIGGKLFTEVKPK